MADKTPGQGESRFNGDVSGDALLNRRLFVGLAGGAVGTAALLAAGCGDDDDDNGGGGGGGGGQDTGADAGRDGGDVGDAGDAADTGDANGSAVVLDFSTDAGVLNYAYALEQLESAFYAAVVAQSFDAAITDDNEQAVFRDINDHEAIHSQFYGQALGDGAIGAVSVDFDAVDFNDRDSVIGTAQTFEDLGVAAYNGAGKYLSDPSFLNAAGKIVSVEARHAAAIRDLAAPSDNYFGGAPGGELVVNDMGLDRAFTPNQVLQAAGQYITTPIEVTNLS